MSLTMKVLVLIFVVVVAQAAEIRPKTNPEISFFNEGGSGRIVGGEEASPHEMKWQVALFVGDRFNCGGSLITDRHVLTAAHCCIGYTSLTIWLGTHDRSVDEPERIIRTVMNSSIHYHEDFDYFNIYNDVCVIDLGEPVPLSDAIGIIQLEENNDNDHAQEEEMISGWGHTSDSVGEAPTALQKAAVPTITNEECDSRYTSYIGPGNICISTEGGKSICFGDSGGPLSHVDPVTNTYTQIGVASFVYSAGCEFGYPAGFARVSYYIDWIKGKIGAK